MVVGHSGAPAWLNRVIYAFHMPCFFIISGMVFKKVYLSQTGIFIKKRIKRLWWPYVKWSVVFLLLHNLFVTYGIYEVAYNWKYTLLKCFQAAVMLSWDLTLLRGFWFLYSLLMASVISVLFFRYIGFSTRRIIGGVVLMLCIASLFSYTPPLGYLPKETFQATAFFMTGVLITRIPLSLFSHIFLKALLLCAIAIILMYIFILPFTEVGSVTAISIWRYFTAACILSCAFITLISKIPHGIISRRLAWIGERTIDILVWHFLAFRAVNYFIITVHNLPINLMQNPVIKEYSNYYWPLYAIAGIELSLLMGDFIRRTTVLLTPHLKSVYTSLRSFNNWGGVIPFRPVSYAYIVCQ